MEIKYGHFPESGHKFIITDPDTPRNWYNYLYNENYITFISQVGFGEGFLQDRKGTRMRLVNGRAVYIAEEGQYWLANALPIEDEREEYACTHDFGCSVIHVKKNGISTDYGLFVPRENDAMLGGEVTFVTVRNESDRERTLSIISYIDTQMDAVQTRQGYTTAITKFDKENEAVVLGKYYKWNGKNVRFYSSLMCNLPVAGYDCAQNGFIGPYGNIVTPKALVRGGHCTNSPSTCEKNCFALETTITLAPQEEKRVLFACSIVDDMAKLGEVRETFLTDAGFTREMGKVKSYFEDSLCGLEIETPFEDLDHLVGGWMPYVTNMGSTWARVRHNGYRDMVSDTECLASFNPTLAKARIKRILTYQYANGYAPRTFLDGNLKDNKFADCTVWLTYAVHTIVMELGDTSLLHEIVKFNDGTEASVYEHLRRSVDFLYNFKGLHGLVRIWGGDWNDNMNYAGLEGKGVSVWLTMAWYRANAQFKELAALLGNEEDVRVASERADEMRELVDEYGWDKEGYYIYAYNDDDKKIGASDGEENRIFLNPQLWSVLSGIDKDGKSRVAMNTAEARLRRKMGCIVQTPPFTKPNYRVGNITRGIAGAYENGSIYLHTIAWKLAVDGILGDRELMEKDLITMLPYRNPVVAGRAEPYAMFNCYFEEETGHRYGTPGQSWRTASGQWMLKAVIHYLFGLKGNMEGLEISPCLPASWKTCRLKKMFRGALVDITYVTADEAFITVNGEKIEGNTVPIESGGTYNIVVGITA